MAKERTTPAKTGSDPQGTRDARDDATIIQWLATLDQDIIVGLKQVDATLRRPEAQEPSAPAPPTLTEIVHALRPAIAVPPPPPETAASPSQGMAAGSEQHTGILAAIKSLMSPLTSFFSSKGDKGMLHAAKGGNFVTEGPTRLLVGEAGPEKVEVTPLGPGPHGKDKPPEHGEVAMQAGGTLTAGFGTRAGQIAGSIAGAVGGILGGPVLGNVMHVITEAMTNAALAVVSFAEKLSAANRVLAEFSPSMALVFGISRMREVERGMQRGEQTAGTAGFLQNALNDLRDTLSPMMVLFRNFFNLVSGALMTLLDVALRPLSLISDGVNKILELLGVTSRTEGAISLGEWMEDIRDDYDRDRDRKRFGPGFATSGGDF